MSLDNEFRQFISENFIVSRQINDEDSLLDNGIIDSTGVLELVSFIEERFGVAVEDEEMVPENLDSIKQLKAFVQRKQHPASV
ncbi:acyl carrier protein [candidate division KSB1 bacterium]|nr:acyl carrier protein [candidate division KSB1 bacterium]